MSAVVLRRRAGADGKLGRGAGTAHLSIVAAVHELDGRFRRLGIRHLFQEFLVAGEEILRLGW